MALHRSMVNFRALDPSDMALWRTIPSSVASDAMNRSYSMDSQIKPVVDGLQICGQARTVVPMLGDNAMVHVACSVSEPGEVVVVAGGALEGIAYAGEWVARACRRRGLGGLVIDGAVRDIREIRALDLPVFCKGAVPRGPHKTFGGQMDVAASVGGVAVHPGDLVIGDDDGVVVVPLGIAEQTLHQCLALLAMERDWSSKIEAGQTLMEVLKIPAPEIVTCSAGL